MSSGLPNKSPYRKPWLSVADQVSKLESRGLHVDDRSDAESFLRHVNYYRFAGYLPASENGRHNLVAGTTSLAVSSRACVSLTIEKCCDLRSRRGTSLQLDW